MKILFYRYGSICEPDIIEQFTALGLEVVTLNHEITNKSLSASSQIDLVADQLSKNKFLFVFSINFFPTISDVCEIYKIPYVGWVVDSPVLELFTHSIKNSCNRIFCFDYKQYETISRFNPNGIFHLPLGTNVARWDKVVSAISSADRRRFSGDISFVGSLYTEKDPFLKAENPSEYLTGYIAGLYEVQKNLQGFNIIESALSTQIVSELKTLLKNNYVSNDACVQDMDLFISAQCILGMHLSSLERMEFLGELSRISPVSLYTQSNTSGLKAYPGVSVRGGVSTLTEMPKVFNLSKINLNMTIHSIETGASLRVWDIMGCGGFLLSNYQTEFDDYLTPGVDYDYYSCKDELIEKCAFYLANESVREKIALTGYEKVKKYHTYANRMPVIFKALQEFM